VHAGSTNIVDLRVHNCLAHAVENPYHQFAVDPHVLNELVPHVLNLHSDRRPKLLGWPHRQPKSHQPF